MWNTEVFLSVLTSKASSLTLDTFLKDAVSKGMPVAGVLLFGPTTLEGIQCIVEQWERSLKTSPTTFTMPYLLMEAGYSGEGTSLEKDE